MCDCSNCRTGKCGCKECSPGPGIDFKGDHKLIDELRAAVAREQVRIRDGRAPSIERMQVRRWGEINVPRIEGDRRQGS